MKKFLLIVVFVFLLTGCAPSSMKEPSSVVVVGNIVSATQVSTSWNELPMMQIETEDYVFIVKGYHSVHIGASVKLIEYEYLPSCIQVGDNFECWEIYE